MKAIYKQNTANYPRLKTDTLFADYGNKFSFGGFVDENIRFIEGFQLLSNEVWERFVHQFEINSDVKDFGWRCEYWGKMMRGACFTYSYTKNPKLKNVLIKTVKDMLAVQKKTGKLSTYNKSTEYNGWDLWGRKYVLLGMQYFLEISTDKSFNDQIIESMCKQVDDIMEDIGLEKDGKKRITLASQHWYGLNSSSILEPIVRLYSLTKKQKYFDFAKYIVDEGGMFVDNLWDLAIEDKLYPYQYPTTKAYEMTSCFEGLLEFYRITGIEKYRIAVINFANKVLESDFTIIGSSGCTHELFDHSTVRQANTNNHFIMQETCVTVTLMKFMYQLNLLTGDVRYVDAFERSMYNAYFGAINTDKVIGENILNNAELKGAIFEPLPFDSYSPLTAGVRGKAIGGLKVMPDKHYYGCCACIGSAGNGLIPKMALLSFENGFAVNLYINGKIQTKTPKGQRISVLTETEYPKTDSVKITLELENPEEFTISLRNPSWSEKTKVFVNGKKVKVCDGYIKITRTWEVGDEIKLSLDLRTRAIRPIPYGSQVLMTKFVWSCHDAVPLYDEEDTKAKNHIALMRGPIVLAQDGRLGVDVDAPCEIKVKKGFVSVKLPDVDTAPYKHVLEVQVPLKNGKTMTLTDYSSAGKTFSDESKMAAWILTK